jgi:indolepyruvate ferredoxin oxidoreductase
MALPAPLPVTLEDKYTLERGRVYLTGIQALVRLPLMQRWLDRARGLNTAGFISGYRGSPLGGLDQNLWRAKKYLEENHIKFEPGLNEDLALTSIWGSQQLNLFPGAKYDGVFAMWYGKGPGVDRIIDALRHANTAGTSKHGGVLVCAGDDHGAASSTIPHQTDHNFISVMMPVLFPANTQEILDYGLFGWAMSRYSGCYVALKCVAENVESSASVAVDPERYDFKIPNNFEMPPGGVNIRWPDSFHEQELRLQRHKAYAALAFTRTNKIDRIVIDSPRPRLGIIASGKGYLDTRQALDDLGIDDRLAAEIGIRLYKVGMVWPLEREGAREFAHGLQEVVVVEEKRALVENQLKEQLYNWSESARPRVVGKFDEEGKWLLPAGGELSPGIVAKALAERILKFYQSDPVVTGAIVERVKFIEAKERALAAKKTDFARIPYFCSGCPHNTSTRVPEGSRATAGIGCHTMALFMDRSTATYTHMGGEGTPWIGQAPFTNETHIFANLGDGTYYHSGLLAIRACVAAKVNITYKLLYNDAVAMTGGQPVEGSPSPADIANQVAAEGVDRIVVVSDDPLKYPTDWHWPAGTTFHHRDELDAVQRDLREWPGVSLLLYEQTCAAEKRRRRKRGLMLDPPRRVFINERVCEGCGDCSVQSNCISVVPKETEFGRKRMIDQSNCNKDYSCVKGFCPSFVSVYGAVPRRAKASGGPKVLPADAIPMPAIPGSAKPFDILVTGIGGTGVITIGQILGMAAHIERKGVTILDMTGLAQKNGAVMSHVRIADHPEQIHAVRIAAGEADAILGCDIVVAASPDALRTMRPGRTRAVVNAYEQVTAAFIRNRDLEFPGAKMRDLIAESVGAGNFDAVDASRLAAALMGDAIASNMFMLGYAFQKGLVPLSLASLEKAIELNAVAVRANKESFAWGRRAAVDLEAVAKIAFPSEPMPLARPAAKLLNDIVAIRVRDLTAYQSRRYAARYERLVGEVRRVEGEKARGKTGLADAVARNFYKLMAYKDEYEVARLFTDGQFQRQLHDAFQGDYKMKFHLAPPLLAPRDPRTGHLQKMTFGAWLMPVFRLLAAMKFLRGSWLDPFGKSAERKAERKLIGEYEATIRALLGGLTPDNHALAVEIASVPDMIRGYGHIKEPSIKTARAKEAELLKAWHDPAKSALWSAREAAE